MTYIPKDYKSSLNLYETQTAIGFIKRMFEDNLSGALNLRRVSAPLFVDPETGLNDDLNGVERAVSFDIKNCETTAQVVHSLAKWKRMALHKYGFKKGEGLYTDMNAIRRDEDMDNIHSIYTDQWDWEKTITEQDRNIPYLKATVRDIIKAIDATLMVLKCKFPQITFELEENVTFVTSQELEDMYPELDAKQRENTFVHKYGTVFIMQIGGKLKSGRRHDGRAPDYDDWTLNGDILVWDDILGIALELSSMGIRVDSAALDRQLTEAGADNRRGMPFHKMLLADELPLTMGGGIGQSRLCMLLLQKAHIGEVQASVWNSETISVCRAAGVELL